MANEKWCGISREKINWAPKIDEEKCTNCGTCVNFCGKGVFDYKDEKVVVNDLYACGVGRTCCDNICPNGAISHPDPKYLDTLKDIADDNFETQSKPMCDLKK